MDEIECTLCGRATREYCEQGACRACHKTESLEDCLENRQANAIRERYGLPDLPPAAPPPIPLESEPW